MRLQRFHIAALATIGMALAAAAVEAQEVVNGVVQNHNFFGQSVQPDEIEIVHGSEFKGANKIAISVFEVAFPNENHYTANSRGHSVLGGTTTSASASVSTTMSGVDQATQQRITDKAFALFVEQLKAAGYEVVNQAELARLAPEFATWDALPNFSPGRFGVYVAPTGQGLRFLQGDAARRDTSGFFGQLNQTVRALDNPLAFSRSPYIARDGNIGVVAVTLVVDYGIYSSATSNRLFGSSKIDFKPGVTIAAGYVGDHATMLEYWGPRSGGFPAYAHLRKPVYSDRAFGTVDDARDSERGSAAIVSKLVADPEKFEIAADEVAAIAVPKLVGAMAAAR